MKGTPESAGWESPALSKLGERIRRARLKLGLTQSELTGGELTRNMLSRIENGIAYPSLPTLCYLAARLNLPPGALLDGPEEYERRRLLSELRRLAEKKNWNAMLTRFEEAGLTIPAGTDGDELRSLLGEAHYRLAWELYARGRRTDAHAKLEEAARFLPESGALPLTLEDVRLAGLVLDGTDPYAAADAASRGEKAADSVCRINDLAAYVWAKSLLTGREGRSYSQPDERAQDVKTRLEPILPLMKDEFLRSHIEAKTDMALADYLSAKARLMKLTAAPDTLPPSLLFELYTDLEICCKCCGDFENAYKYASSKLALSRRIQ